MHVCPSFVVQYVVWIGVWLSCSCIITNVAFVVIFSDGFEARIVAIVFSELSHRYLVRFHTIFDYDALQYSGNSFIQLEFGPFFFGPILTALISLES